MKCWQCISAYWTRLPFHLPPNSRDYNWHGVGWIQSIPLGITYYYIRSYWNIMAIPNLDSYLNVRIIPNVCSSSDYWWPYWLAICLFWLCPCMYCSSRKPLHDGATPRLIWVWDCSHYKNRDQGMSIDTPSTGSPMSQLKNYKWDLQTWNTSANVLILIIIR